MLTDFGPLGGIGDDHAVARHLIREVGVAVVPGSSFYGTAGLGRDTIRWAFAKKLETLDRVADPPARAPAAVLTHRSAAATTARRRARRVRGCLLVDRPQTLA